MLGAKSAQCSVVRAKEIHCQGDGRNRAVCQSWLLKYNRWTVVFHQEVSNGSRFVNHVNWAGDANEFTSAFEVAHPTAQGLPCHELP